EVKRRSADGSVGSPHVRVGNCQASNKQRNLMRKHGVFLLSAIQEKRPNANRIGRCAARSACSSTGNCNIKAYCRRLTPIFHSIPAPALSFIPNTRMTKINVS
ncbi:hypothetical protein, partial [Raoultella terrigena]|uniref:hypothetical protein n=1 Tax=Raoultella terrigena TaxID=577 RepID=UPI00384A977A